MLRHNRCIVTEMFCKYSLFVLILYILAFLCMVLVCLRSPLKWLYQSNLVTCQLPWNWLIHQKCDTSRLFFDTWNALFVSNHSNDDIVHMKKTSTDMCWNFIKVIVPVTDVSASFAAALTGVVMVITNLKLNHCLKKRKRKKSLFLLETAY